MSAPHLALYGLIACTVVVTYLVLAAPLGWEDESTGFQFGEQPFDNPDDWGSQ